MHETEEDKYPTDPDQHFQMANRPQHRIPGHNVDAIDVVAGLDELDKMGGSTPETLAVITYALQRHARGEEAAARRSATDKTFHGIDLTGWYRVLAAARAHGEAALAKTSATTCLTPTNTTHPEESTSMTDTTIIASNPEILQLVEKLRSALQAGIDTKEVETLIKSDQEGAPYVFIEQKLPSRVYAEIEDGTYGALQGFRLYIGD